MKCPECEGLGVFATPCVRCGATGEIENDRLCRICWGSGEEEVACATCDGTGYVLEEDSNDHHRLPEKETA